MLDRVQFSYLWKFYDVCWRLHSPATTEAHGGFYESLKKIFNKHKGFNVMLALAACTCGKTGWLNFMDCPSRELLYLSSVCHQI